MWCGWAGGRTSDEFGMQGTTDSDCGTPAAADELTATAAAAGEGGDRPQLSATFMSSPQHWITSM